jgi:phosphate transport system substrate-binding protein
MSSRLRFHVLRFTQAAGLLVLIVMLVSCAETPQVTRTPVTLRLAEAADQAQVLQRLIADYTQNRTWVKASSASLSPADALNRVRSSQLDAAIIHQAPEANAGVWVSGLAHDPIAIIVHPTNPITGVTLQQLNDLFLGRTFDWTPFGGSGEVIPVSREAEAHARQLFEERIMQNRAVTRNAILKASSQDLLDFVADTPGAIGYAPLSHLDSRVKAIPVEGVAPTAETAAAGKYVLSSPLYLIARSEPQGDLREFVAWLLGNEGQTLIDQWGLGRVR